MWVDVPSSMTSFDQSECFISALCSYAILNFVYDIRPSCQLFTVVTAAKLLAFSTLQMMQLKVDEANVRISHILQKPESGCRSKWPILVIDVSATNFLRKVAQIYWSTFLASFTNSKQTSVLLHGQVLGNIRLLLTSNLVTIVIYFKTFNKYINN